MTISCTLDAAALQRRLAHSSLVAAGALRSRRPIAGGTRLTFTDSPATRRTLADLLAAEAECCAFLTMQLTRSGGELRLDVTGPEAAQPIIEELFALEVSWRTAGASG